MGQSASLPIAVRQLTKTYGAVHALDHVDLDVRSGEFLTLLGPSGSGKTTLLMVLAGFVRPDHGSVLFGDAGGDPARAAQAQHRHGVPELRAVSAHGRGRQHRLPAASCAASAAREIAAPRREALELVQLGGYGERRIDQLSGGQRQRVALARAIVFEPRILLMDEPLSALDKQLREHMQIELRRLHDKLGTTTIYVTHDQREALTMSDRIAVINHGRVMQLDTPRAHLRAARQPLRRRVHRRIDISRRRGRGRACAASRGGRIEVPRHAGRGRALPADAAARAPAHPGPARAGRRRTSSMAR